MNRKFTTYQIDNFIEFKTKMLNWANQFNIFCLLDNHQYNFSEPSFECMLAAGCTSSFSKSENDFDGLQQFITQQKDWIFGHLNYDLKNKIEDLSSANFDGIQFPDLFFFVSKIILILTKNKLDIGVVDDNADEIFNAIQLSAVNILSVAKAASVKSRFSRDEYLNAVQQIQQHILRGDCYEINFCQEFYAEDIQLDPINIYSRLGKISPNPFAALYKLEDKFLICSSPERYLKKDGAKIYSQPIKGTSKRDLNNDNEDHKSKESLLKSDKETAENVMVVDLVRNDLSKVCEEGSVKVEELFGLYTFPQVHQMISTVSGIVKHDVSFTDILKSTFPMGSMTGVPKKRVMELIEKYEKTKRGLFSGSIGYINPQGDFDFNVVIRSILYNSTSKYVSMQAGSAITFYSDAEKEYGECLLKIGAMKKVLE